MLLRSTFSFIFFLLTVSPALVYAQTIHSVSGRAVNTKNEPFTGNALALSVKDSSVIKATTFDKGGFVLTGIDQQEVIIKLTSLQFHDTLIRISYSGRQDIDLGNILAGEAFGELNEVRIKSRTPLIRQTGNGNMEVNVANSILATSSSVNEILSRTPNVIINEDGQTQIIGKGEAIIYLNGKRISSEQMATIPASQITKIEIIANPSSKYDAEGKAVINIITKLNTNEGIRGTVSQHVTVSDFAGTSANTFLNLSYAKGRFSMAGNYGLRTGKEKEFLYTVRNRPKPDEYLNSELTTDWQRRFNSYHNYGLGVQYNFSEKTNVSLAYSGNRDHLGGTIDSKNKITTNSGESDYSSSIAKNETRYNHSVTLNFNTVIDSLGSAFFAGSQYSYYNAAVKDFIDETGKVDNTMEYRFLKNNMNQDISISSTQADYIKAFNVKTRLETGAKFSYVTNGSGTSFLTAGSRDGDFQLDTGLSNKFSYTEKIAAAYITYNSRIGSNINVSAGIRSEWTNYTLNTTAGNGQLIKDNYFNWFPNLQVQIPVSAQLTLRGSYIARISRPRYQWLNPTVIYQDPFTTIEGNPNLTPEKTHAFELGVNYKKFDLKLGYSYTTDAFGGGAIRGNTPSSYVLKNFNIQSRHLYFMTLSKAFNIKWWSTVNTVNLQYRKDIDNEYNFVMRKPKPQLYFYSSNTFNIKDLFSIQLLGWYLGKEYSGLFYRNSRATITAGIEKSFLNNTFKLNFTANDIFYQSANSGDYSVGQTDIYFHRSYTTNYFKLVATYNFGRLKRSDYKNKATGQSENSRAE